MNKFNSISFADIHSKEVRSRLFPVVNKAVYLNHAAIGPLPEFAASGYKRYLEKCMTRGEKHWEESFQVVENARNQLVTYLGCNTDEVAFTKNVSEGFSILSSGLELKPGDEILFGDIEFPANVYPWLNLEKKGIKARYIKSENGVIGPDQIERALTASTRLVSLSSVQFFSGYRSNLNQVGKMLSDKKVLFCVDAVQHIGAFELDVNKARIDFLACAAHKWLMCGEGLGFVFCRKELAEKIDQKVVGWQSVENWQDFFSHDLIMKPGALRFETGGMPVANIYALEATLKFLFQVGIQNISSQIISLSEKVRKDAVKRGFEIVCDQDKREQLSGITTFKPGRKDAAVIVEKLAEQEIYVSNRNGNIRVSPNYYNNHADIDALFSAIDNITY